MLASGWDRIMIAAILSHLRQFAHHLIILILFSLPDKCHCEAVFAEAVSR
jgi:hypothetical protein